MRSGREIGAIEEHPERPIECLQPSRLKDGTLEPNRGLLSLPEPRPGDLFFDIEGDPYAFDDGIEYLFGVLEPNVPDANGNSTFHAFWARDAAGRVTRDSEKLAFEQLMDFFMERVAQDPAIHIYHYAPYEPTALGKLMGRHGTRETDVKRWVYRTERVGRGSIRISIRGTRASPGSSLSVSMASGRALHIM